MSTNSTYWLAGGAAAAAALVLLATSSKNAEAAEEAETGDDGDEYEPLAAVGFNPARYVSEGPEMGRVFTPARGDILLGEGRKSVTYRVLYDAAELAGHPDPQQFAGDSANRVGYAKLILAAPANAVHLTRKLRKNDFRDHRGLGIDLRTQAPMWLPILCLDMAGQGVVSVAYYEEDGLPATELPPELRKALQ